MPQRPEPEQPGDPVRGRRRSALLESMDPALGVHFAFRLVILLGRDALLIFVPHMSLRLSTREIPV